MHLNFGYVRNNNRVEERENLNHISLAGEYGMSENLRCVADIGQERNPDRTMQREPAFGLLGVIYGISGMSTWTPVSRSALRARRLT